MRILAHELLIAGALSLAACAADTTTTPPGGKHNTGDSNHAGDHDNVGDGAGGTGSIYDVQTPGGSASAVGTPVSFQNVVVTAVDRFGARTGVIYVQEQAGGAYSGVALYSGNGIQVNNSTLGTLAVGDIVNVDNGEVDEFALTSDTSGRTLTEVVSRMNMKLTVTKVSSGTPPAPVVVLPWTLATNLDEAEKWEGVLIRFENVAVISAAAVIGGTGGTDQTLAKMRVTGPFIVESSLTALVDTASPPASLYHVGDCFASVSGIGDYFFDYLLLPRDASDIVTGGTGCATQETNCTDTIDNDHNGYADCADFACQASTPSCTAATTVIDIQKGIVAVNTPVQVEGVVVTAIKAGTSATQPKYVWVEDPTGVDFSGIAVYKATAPAGLAIGDQVTVKGVTTEYSGGGTGSVTEIQSTAANPATITKTGTASVPTPMVLSPAALVAPPTPNPYDGLLVKVVNVKVTNINPDKTTPDPAPYGTPNFGEWTVSDSNLRIDDLLMPSQGQPVGIAVGDCYTSVVGVFDYSFGNFKIEPRSAADLTMGTGCP
jgi:predicted extracellular nuclease